MSVLLRLREDLCQSILSEWITAGSWGRLDAALSSKQLRPQFLEYIQSCACNVDVKLQGNPNFYKWVYVRSIFLCDYVIDRHCFNKKKQLAFDVHFGNVESLDLRLIEAPKYNFVNLCSNLSRLVCDNSEVIFSMESAVLNQLLTFVVGGVMTDQIPVITVIRDHCRSLTELKLCFDDDDVDTVDDLLTDIFEENPNLAYLCIYCNEGFIRTIARLCSNLVKVELKGVWDLFSAAFLIDHCKLLKKLRLDARDDEASSLQWTKTKLSCVGSGITIEGWDYLASVVGGITCFSVESNPSTVVPVFIAAMLDGVRTLRTVHILKCSVVHVSTLELLFSYRNITTLHLDLKEMNGEVKEKLPQMRTKLKTLHITAPSLSVSWILNLLENNRFLTAGYFSNVPIMIGSDDSSRLEMVSTYLADPSKFCVSEKSRFHRSLTASIEFSGANFMLEGPLFKRVSMRSVESFKTSVSSTTTTESSVKTIELD